MIQKHKKINLNKNLNFLKTWFQTCSQTTPSSILSSLWFDY